MVIFDYVLTFKKSNDLFLRALSARSRNELNSVFIEKEGGRQQTVSLGAELC